MKAKYTVGDVVNVSFTGEVTEVKFDSGVKGVIDDRIVYTVKITDSKNWTKAIALAYTDAILTPAPTPEAVNNG
jgi:hypothetical protein